MFFLHLRNRHFFVLDALLLALTPALALGLRVDASSYTQYIRGLALFTAISLPGKLLIFFAFNLHRRYWLYASIEELMAIGLASFTATIAVAGVFYGAQAISIFDENMLPRSLPFIDGILTVLVVGASRFSVRVAYRQWMRHGRARETKSALIVGAGDAGKMIARELQTSQHVDLLPVGFIDDDINKQGMQIYGVPVLGTRKQLRELISKYKVQEVIIALPSATGEVIRQVVRACDTAGVTYKTVPAIYEVLLGRVSMTRLRAIQIEDLLRREPVQVSLTDVRAMIAGRRVLVTGAGGSIGAELCRQIVRSHPAQLVALGHGENSLFTLNNELLRFTPKKDTGEGRLDLKVVVADVRDRSRLECLFRQYRPEIVFHAAAHKHVPLMEDNPEDAVTNNVLGTRHVAELSEIYGVERFVLISTDKAVNPVSVMGATKRVAELIVGMVAQRAQRPYVSVRFGNVLGSRGSVVPLFRQQIAEGGPVTVTDPEVKRYFMTIPEAVQLVLQAAVMSQGGEVFVLDMGQPVKIVDLARDLIELSGYQVGRDIDIVYTGLRSGEKLFEELFLDREDYSRTSHTHIFVARNTQAHSASIQETLVQHVNKLINAAQAGRSDEVSAWLKTIVPEYSPEGDTVSVLASQLQSSLPLQ